jgi:hypothetical protein
MKDRGLLRSILKIIAMALAVGATGLVLALGAGFLLSVLMRNQFGGWGALLGAILGILLFFPAGVVLGLIIFKIWRYQGFSLARHSGCLFSRILDFRGRLPAPSGREFWHFDTRFFGADTSLGIHRI